MPAALLVITTIDFAMAAMLMTSFLQLFVRIGKNRMKFKNNRFIEFIHKLLKCFNLVLKKSKFMLYHHDFNPAIFIDKPGHL